MPYGYSTPRVPSRAATKKKQPQQIKTVKGVSVAKLSMRQRQAMKRHSAHHTKQHISFMKNAMVKGSTFTAAHKAAMKAVGK